MDWQPVSNDTETGNLSAYCPQFCTSLAQCKDIHFTVSINTDDSNHFSSTAYHDHRSSSFIHENAPYSLSQSTVHYVHSSGNEEMSINEQCEVGKNMGNDYQHRTFMRKLPVLTKLNMRYLQAQNEITNASYKIRISWFSSEVNQEIQKLSVYECLGGGIASSEIIFLMKQNQEDLNNKHYFSDFHIFLNELQESNRTILKRLDDLLQTSEEDHRLRFQEEHGNALIGKHISYFDLENRIKLIEANDLKREKELKELQQSLKILMEKKEHTYGIFSEGNPRATVRFLGKNVEINSAGISDIGAFQQQSDMVAVSRTFIQQEISFITPEHCSDQKEGILEGEDQDRHAAPSPNVSSEHEIERPFLEESVSGDAYKLRLVKTPGFSALEIPGSESAGLNVNKEHPSSLRDSKETSVDFPVGHILRSEMEEVLTENISSSENSTIDASVDNHTQSNRAVNMESDIVSVCHGVDYNFGSLQRKDVGQRDPEEKKAQPSGNVYTESESGYVSSRSDTSVHSDHELIAANLSRHSVNKKSDSGGKNSWPQRSKNVPRVKQAAAFSFSYSNQPVLKLIAYDHVTSSDNQLQQNSSHVAEHQDNINFSKTKMPEKENIDLDYDMKVELIHPMMWQVIAKAEYDEGTCNFIPGSEGNHFTIYQVKMTSHTMR
ncbi:hypothetical protein CHS0354_037952 [Potamilus streckersoni]|uniref:Uncharacterized protein n=1 Tax=Potamilus streckersoni TaxID=2493646 RepID=A0AAE0T9L1_9BIVA|nr:hypothetical protein CHS0354_037952 [Potamilus streckersoni]